MATRNRHPHTSRYLMKNAFLPLSGRDLFIGPHKTAKLKCNSSSEYLHFSHGKETHFHQQNSVFEAAYLCFAVLSCSVAYRYFNYSKIEFRSSEEEIKITERIKITEIVPVCRNCHIVFTAYDFCTAKGVFDSLAQEP